MAIKEKLPVGTNVSVAMQDSFSIGIGNIQKIICKDSSWLWPLHVHHALTLEMNTLNISVVKTI